MPPNPPAQIDWVILQRFASLEAATSLAEFQPSGCGWVEDAQPMLVGQDDVHICDKTMRWASCRHRSRR